MNIKTKIGKMCIEYNLHSQLMQNQLLKYQSECKMKYYISSEICLEFPICIGKPIYRCTFFEIYEQGNYIFQRLINNNHVYGLIKYQQNKACCYVSNYKDEFIISQYAVVYYLLKDYKAIYMHSSIFKFKNRTIALLADSGMGKSTHSSLWAKYEDITFINDDKNFVYLEEGKLIVYGNPYSGQFLKDNNISSELTDLVFLSRGLSPSIGEESVKNAFLKLITHISNTSYMYDKEKWNLLVDKLLTLKLWNFKCNMERESVECLKSILMEEK